MQFTLVTMEYPCLPAGRHQQYGGIATYYEGMVGALRQAGHTVDVVREGLLSRWMYPRWLIGVLTLRKFLKKTSVDFLIVGQILPLGTIAYLFKKRVPYIVATHGMDLALAAQHPRKKYMAATILCHAHRVVANSEFTKRLILSFGVPEKNVVIMHPCPQSFALPSDDAVQEVRTTFGLSGKRVIVSVGRLVARKGFDTLIAAMPHILKQHPNAVLVIAGDGNDRDRLAKSIVEHGIQGSVRMVGAVDNATVAALYQSADVFAMPCRAIGPDVEGFGTVYLEAGLFGVPSVAGNSGGAPEAVIDGKTGLVVEPTPETVARAIEILLSQEDVRARLGAGAQEYATGCTWKKNIDKLLKSVAKLRGTL